LDAAMRSYYRRRAPEYDDWWHGTGRFAERDRPGWEEDVAALCEALAALPPARTLDLACGTGFLTAHLPGDVTGLDQSEEMLAIAAARLPHATFVRGDALDPAPALRAAARRDSPPALRAAAGRDSPAAPGAAFERVHAGHFYGHLDERQRRRFLAAAERLAPELVVTDSALRPDGEAEAWQERILDDGSSHRVYKRWFTAAGLAAEVRGGEILHDGPWFVAVRRRAP
jgi:SAM-dependent methyltransferase